MLFRSFKDHWQRPLFTIVRERQQAAQCDAFVRHLLNRIDWASGAAPPAPESEEAADEEAPPIQWKWQAAVASGAIMLLGVPLANLAEGLGMLVMVLLIGGAVGAAVGAWQSFAENERRKYWSLLGVALALLTFFVG